MYSSPRKSGNFCRHRRNFRSRKRPWWTHPATRGPALDVPQVEGAGIISLDGLEQGAGGLCDVLFGLVGLSNDEFVVFFAPPVPVEIHSLRIDVLHILF